ncbi:MAG: peptidoglycan editing factor PgeF [Rubrivivax sp.]|nr:peptidoglycan editing factor PgeF [Rubrivivax sp.]
MTTRRGGVSRGPWASLNLGRSVGDDAQAVAENRRRFSASLCRAGGGAAPARPVWLHQVHGTQVLELGADTPEHVDEPADAAWTRTPGIACVVGAADCLPVLLAARDGRAVAAAHAGWRGLAGGVLEATVRALARDGGVEPARLVAWLGPCIGAQHFEVGADVLRAFGAEPASDEHGAGTRFFRYTPRADGTARWHADLRALAHDRLRRLGVGAITVDPPCTHADELRFFSFRRDSARHPGCAGGRMAAAVWIERG